MKLARKFTLALLLGMCAVLAAAAYSTVFREINLFENDMLHDHQVMGRAFSKALAEVWELQGEARALELARSFSSSGSVEVRWLPRTSADEGSLSRKEWAALVRGEEILHRDPRWRPGSLQHTYFAVKVLGEARGALELSESLA